MSNVDPHLSKSYLNSHSTIGIVGLFSSSCAITFTLVTELRKVEVEVVVVRRLEHTEYLILKLPLSWSHRTVSTFAPSRRVMGGGPPLNGEFTNSSCCGNHLLRNAVLVGPSFGIRLLEEGDKGRGRRESFDGPALKLTWVRIVVGLMGEMKGNSGKSSTENVKTWMVVGDLYTVSSTTASLPLYV